jgi:hypothetical protein
MEKKELATKLGIARLKIGLESINQGNKANID